MSKHYAIKCTNCAAPLDILGGGRVTTVTCSYCHSVLDMNDRYKVLAKFKEVKRPQGPFQVGMRGNIKGVEWTIIGWVAYKTGEFPSEEWDEFFLYSPTHGYAWLVYEDNKVYFSKKVRDFDILTWQEKKPKTLFYHKGHYIQNEAKYLTYIDYVEGELNWIAKFGDRFDTWDYHGVGFKVLNIEKTGEELEVYHTEQLNKADIYNAFYLEYTEKSKERTQVSLEDSNHIDDTTPKYILSSVKWISTILGIMVLFSFFMGKPLFDNKLKTYDINTSIHVTSDAFLSKITLKASRYNNLSKFNLILIKEKSTKPYFHMNINTIFFSKKHIENRWKRYANSVTVYLKLDKGKYTLSLNHAKGVHVKMKQVHIRLFYIFPTFIIALLLLSYIYRHLFTFSTFLGFIGFIVLFSIIFIEIPFVYVIGILFLLTPFFNLNGDDEEEGFFNLSNWKGNWREDWRGYNNE